MHHIHTTSTAVEKLNRAAKSLRRSTGCTLAAALDQEAQQAGYLSWKNLTECAKRSGSWPRNLLPSDHRPVLFFMRRTTDERVIQVKSVDQLGDLIGGMQPVVLRLCEHARASETCLCQIDPFATAVQANFAMQPGEKDGVNSYFFDPNEPAQRYESRAVKMKLRIDDDEYYPNDHLVTTRNDDRSNSRNPNNPAHQASRDNRSMQLNPENPRFAG